MEFNATFLVSVISFIIFTIIMNKIFYKPLENVMDERQKFIDDAKSDALNSNNRADAILKEKEDRLNKSASDSKKLVADKLNAANEREMFDELNVKTTEISDIIDADVVFISF